MNASERKYLTVFLTFFLILILAFTACSRKPDDNTGDPEITELPTERPTEVPMRDLSADTPLYDTLVYANRIANEVQAFYSGPSRKAFTVCNAVSRFELDLSEGSSRGIAYFADSAGNNYFTGSMDAYVIDNAGVEWSDRYSGSYGRQNTYRLGYYYTEVHLMDLSLGIAGDGDVNFRSVKDIFLKDSGWSSHMCDVAYVDRGVKITVTNPYDPYAYYKLKTPVAFDDVNAVRISVISDKDVSANLYYYDRTHSGFNGEQQKGFSLVGDGIEHTYVVRLDSLSGDLMGVRLDPNGDAGDSFTVTRIEAVKTESSIDIRTDRTYHVYSDKLHQAFRFVAASDVPEEKEYGIVWKVPEDSVDALQIRDANGIHGDLVFDGESVEYVAFHIKNNGVVGIIVPVSDSGGDKVRVGKTDGYYIVRQYTDSAFSLKKGRDHTVANRLYNDKSGGFDLIDAAAYAERHPLSDITVLETDSKAKFAGYDHVKGCYLFTKTGTDFSRAYQKKQRNKYYTSTVSVKGDGTDRNLYMRFEGEQGCLECAALLDGNKMLVPVPMEVCKNFCGEYEEPFYDPKDTMYGDSIFPLSVKAGNELTFTELHLYQNWGAFALKQVSSIQFFIGYYHLSTGVTESNCIAPYFVYGKDGWTLPDFRGCSGKMWSSQPQFTSVGIHKWLSYTDGSGKKYQSEYTGTKINSAGPTYADIEYSYLSDCGSYRYTLRHVEFPQNDENRTYYTISVEFLKDFTLENAKNDFTIIHFNSRDNNFSRFTYLDRNGDQITETLPESVPKNAVYDLNKGSFYYAIYGAKDSAGKYLMDPMNYALIMRSSDVTVGGKKWDGAYSVRYSFDGSLDNLSLTFDEGRMEFRKGDRMEFNVILLPYGGKVDEVNSHAPVVYGDSVLRPLTVTASTGTVIDDEYIPKVKAENNAAEFTVSGSRNLNTVVVYGFDVLSKPSLFIKAGEGWAEYVTSVSEFDGYQVALSEDGTYAYSFVYDQTDPENEITFRIELKK